MSSNVLCGQSGLLGLPSVRVENKNVSSSASVLSLSGIGDLKTPTNANTTNANNNQQQPLQMTSLADAKLNPYLRVDRKKLKSDPTTGMDVYKISKVRTRKHHPTRNSDDV
ncbi:MAG: hypothetical protein ACI8RD_010789 [Bacillariaceae sp.]|jgi:hypothetical protein